MQCLKDEGKQDTGDLPVIVGSIGLSQEETPDEREDGRRDSEEGSAGISEDAEPEEWEKDDTDFTQYGETESSRFSLTGVGHN